MEEIQVRVEKHIKVEEDSADRQEVEPVRAQSQGRDVRGSRERRNQSQSRHEQPYWGTIMTISGGEAGGGLTGVGQKVVALGDRIAYFLHPATFNATPLDLYDAYFELILSSSAGIGWAWDIDRYRLGTSISLSRLHGGFWELSAHILCCCCSRVIHSPLKSKHFRGCYCASTKLLLQNHSMKKVVLSSYQITKSNYSIANPRSFFSRTQCVQN
ncbi:hypothetical protein CR513_62756, partial [Mucuna pruriens]